ncbi:MAG: VanW family protein, partial [Acidimicrobiia bacterium]
MRDPGARVTSARKTGIVVASVFGALVVLWLGIWALDALTGGTAVRRNVHIAGRDVGGLDEAGLATVMDEIGGRVAATPVEIDVGDRLLESTLGDLGVALDRDATADAAFDARGDGFVLFRPFSWLGSFFTDDDAPVELTLDTALAADAAARLGEAVEVSAIEPSLAYVDGDLRTVAGKPGSQLDVAAVVNALNELDGDGLDGTPVRLTAPLVPVPPQQSDDSAVTLLATVRDHLDQPLDVRFGEDTRTLDPAALAPYLSAQLTDGGKLVLSLDPQPTLQYLAETFADVGTPPVEPELGVEGGEVVLAGGEDGTACCAPTAVTALSTAIEQGARSVDLELAPKAPERDTAYFESLGIKEEISSFTTQHPCCAPRVDNIHRMADIVGAAVIPPGGTFSLNDTVGRRTIENGFKAAPVIDGDGNFQEDVGGGVSQFSTTLFNAAFFAGLEIDEYMAHGLYISRYPYGREATLSFPGPDLKIRNITPYGILIWPTYTDTSITVTMYSTKYIEASQSGQSEALYGKVCTQVTTLRSRTWLDTGKTETDRFYALYGPAEGVQCDGTIRPKDGSTTTTSTTPDGSTTTVAGDPGSTTTTAAATDPGSSTTAP